MVVFYWLAGGGCWLVALWRLEIGDGWRVVAGHSRVAFGWRVVAGGDILAIHRLSSLSFFHFLSFLFFSPDVFLCFSSLSVLYVPSVDGLLCFAETDDFFV